jgi:hypothetical protein
MPLDWDDGRRMSATLEISKRLTARFMGFINGLSKTGEFSDRMQQYVISCMQAIMPLRSWPGTSPDVACVPLGVAGALRSPSAVPDVVRDLPAPHHG